MLNTDETIIALSSPAGRAARAIVRLSGPQALQIANASFQIGQPGDAGDAGDAGPQRSAGTWQASGGHFILSRAAAMLLRVPATLLLMPGPRSYTRQDVAEIHLPGNPALVQEVLAQLVSHGARPAAPGEFTARAFLGGRLDLAQAEAVMAVINAAGSRSLAAAQHLLQGALSAPVGRMMDELRMLLAEVELAIDFSYENLPTPSPLDLRRRTLLIRDQVVALGRRATTMDTDSTDLRVVLVGRPNVGKSSLFNRLAQSAPQRAIVSDIPGTTRDEIRAAIAMGDFQLVLSDTAGLDEAMAALQASPAQRRLHQAGQARTFAALARAELVLIIAEAPRLAADPAAADDVARLAANLATAVVLVINKCDLAAPGLSAEVTAQRASAALRQALAADSADDNSSQDSAGADPPNVPPPIIITSAAAGLGLDDLKQAIAAALQLGRIDRSSDAVTVTARHRACLDEAAATLARAADIAAHPAAASPPDEAAAGPPHELLALELREALDVLGEITGRTSPQALLQQIFSQFCIGK